jgi:Right handed beta helix region
MNCARLTRLLAVVAAALTFGATPAVGADPIDAPSTNRTFSAAFLLTLPFALGEVDQSTIGVPDSAFALVGPIGVAASSGDGPNMFIVDNDLAQCPNAAFTSIQAAVNASGPGDQIRVCPGDYFEQVEIEGPQHDGLRLFSQQPLAAVIHAPQPVMAEPGDIVAVIDAEDVTIQHFKITGPLPDTAFCSLETRTGVRVYDNGSAIIKGNHITEIRSTSPALRGCQNGIGIRVGRQLQVPPTFGTAWISHNRIDLYQKGAIVVDGEESYATVDHNEVVHGPPDVVVIAPNGIQISRGAGADVGHNVVTENNGGAQGSGILLFQPGANELDVHHNKVFRNDDGIALFDTDGAAISNNRSFEQTVFDGIFANSQSMGNTIDHNHMHANTEHDCHDESTGGGTAGTANFWIHDKGLTQNRPGLCKR